MQQQSSRTPQPVPDSAARQAAAQPAAAPPRTARQRTAPFTMPARCTPLAVETAAPVGGAAAAPAEPGAGAGAPGVPNSDVSKSMTSAALASDTVPAVACTRFSGGAPAGVAVACAARARRLRRADRAVLPALPAPLQSYQPQGVSPKQGSPPCGVATRPSVCWKATRNTPRSCTHAPPHARMLLAAQPCF